MLGCALGRKKGKGLDDQGTERKFPRTTSQRPATTKASYTYGPGLLRIYESVNLGRLSPHKSGPYNPSRNTLAPRARWDTAPSARAADAAPKPTLRASEKFSATGLYMRGLSRVYIVFRSLGV